MKSLIYTERIFIALKSIYRSIFNQKAIGHLLKKNDVNKSSGINMQLLFVFPPKRGSKYFHM